MNAIAGTLNQLGHRVRSYFKPARTTDRNSAKGQSRSEVFPPADKIGRTEELVDIAALIGEALVLNNGTFVRLLEVWPVDLEGAEPGLRRQYWIRFANALRRLPAPMTLQVVVTSQPQALGPYLERLNEIAAGWTARAEESSDPEVRARRAEMARRTAETAAFLQSVCDTLKPMHQRYLVAVPVNPFPEALTHKTQDRLLDDAILTKALDELEQRLALVRAALGEIGLTLVEVDPVTACQLLWEHYHPPASRTGRDLGAAVQLRARGAATPDRPALPTCPTREEIEAAASDPAQLALLLAPELTEESPDASYVRLGDCVARGYEIFDFDPRTPVDFAAVLAFPADTTHALYFETLDLETASRQYRNQEIDLKASQILSARRGAVLDHGRAAAIDSVEASRAQLERTLEPPFNLNWCIALWAGDVAALDQHCQQFETQLKVRRLRFRRTTRRHLSLIESLRPLARPAYAFQGRNMTADSLGSFFPFVRREYLDPQGRFYGVHRGNGLLVCLEPFDGGRANASEIILGAPRSGKSLYMKQQIETCLQHGDRVFVIDPEREYLPLAVDHHGLYLEMGKRNQPQQLPRLDPRDPDSYIAGAVDLAREYEWLASQPLTQAQEAALFRAYEIALGSAGIDRVRPETWDTTPPPLSTLIAALREPQDPAATEVARVLDYLEGLSGGNVVNILQPDPDSEEPWTMALETLAGFVEARLGERLDSLNFNVLAASYETLMRRWGFDPRDPASLNRTAPTLADLVEELRQARDPHGHELAAALYPWSHGIYRDIFSGPTNVDLGPAPLVIFGLRSLSDSEQSLAPVVVWQIFNLVWNQIVAGSGSGQHVQFYCDEARFILDVPGAARRLQTMARRYPKYGAALHLALHLAGDDAVRFAQTFKDETVVRDLARIRVLFRQESEAAVRALSVFGVSEAAQADLLQVGKGEGWLLFGNDTHIPLYVPINPSRLARLASNQAQMQSIARASGRRTEPVV